MANIALKTIKFPGIDTVYTIPVVGAVASENIVPISKGGTGATTAADARAALKVVNKTGDTMTGDLAIAKNNYPTVRLKDANDNNCFAIQANTETKGCYFYTYPVDNSGYAEGYSLPTATDGLTSSHYYRILTTKNKVSLEQGGTGMDFSTLGTDHPFAIIRATSNSETYPYLYYTPTANGAFYATGADTEATFGTLPIAQGGTGATDKDTALQNLGGIPYKDSRGANYNMDTTIAQGTHFEIHRTSENTLGTPKAANLTTLSSAAILSFSSSTTYGSQLAMTSGGQLFYRNMNNGTINRWNRLLSNILTANDYGTAFPTTNLVEGRLFFLVQ